MPVPIRPARSLRLRLGYALILAVCAVSMFAVWMDLSVIDPRNTGWLLHGNDQGQNSLGLIAYLRRLSPWPSLHDPLLMSPEGLSVALTDSNPLLAILLRPFASMLPDGWQYAGLWLLACLALQIAFAWKLLRPFARDGLSLVAGTALLACAPVLFARYGHINLCAQWLILWALYLFIDDERIRQPFTWAALIALTGLVHPYLLVMVAAIWASAQMRLLIADTRPMIIRLAGFLPGLVALVAVPWAIGFLDTPLASTGSYGTFNMALDALWNAGNQGYSALLPAASTSPSQGFEGMNYLGAGILLLIVMIAGAVAMRRHTTPEPTGTPSLKPLLWLIPAFLVLGAIAIGPNIIWHGRIVLTIPVPGTVIDMLDPLRASGRMFWPVYYTIIFASVATASRLPRGSAMLLLALLVQTLDFAPALQVMRGFSTESVERPMFDRTPSPEWQVMVGQASAIEFHPYEAYRDLAVMEQVAWRAITACRPVPLRWFYASREPVAIRMRAADDLAKLNAGWVDPTRLYVFLNDTPPRAVFSRAERIDGVWIIRPSRPLPRKTGCGDR